MTLYDKLAACTSPGGIQHMVQGSGLALVKVTELERLQKSSAELNELLRVSEELVQESHKLRRNYDALAEEVGETQIDVENLYEAAHALYMAGYWELPGQLPSEAEQDELWSNLRDALGLEAGGTSETDEEFDPDIGYVFKIERGGSIDTIPGIDIIPGIVLAPEKVLVIDHDAETEPTGEDSISEQLEEIINLLYGIEQNTEVL